MSSVKVLFRAALLLVLVSLVAPQLLGTVGAILGDLTDILKGLIDNLFKGWEDTSKFRGVTFSSRTQDFVKNLGPKPSGPAPVTTTTVGPPPPGPAATTTTTTTTTTTQAPTVDYPQTIKTDLRLMTKAQWKKFTDAVNQLGVKKPDPNNPESILDVFAGIHRYANAPEAHNGPAFLAFHATYMHALSEATHQIDADVEWPIYDSRPDSQIPSHCDSCIYTQDFLGNSQGVVTIGPFANRKVYPNDCATSEFGPILTRACRADYKPLLYDYKEFADVISGYKEYSDFVQPYKADFEKNHGGLHVATGGHLNILSCASNDPFFYMLHGFIHSMFDICMDRRFTMNQQVNMLYPTTGKIQPEQQANAKTLPFDLTLQQSLTESMKRNTRYQIVPDTCNSDSNCNPTNSDFNCFWCKISGSLGRCASKIKIGGACKDNTNFPYPDKACFKESDCSQDPTCTAGVCTCVTTSGAVRNIPIVP